MQLTYAVAFALLEPVLRGQPFMLGFDDGEGDGLGSRSERATENVIGATSSALAGLVIDDVDGLSRFFDADVSTAVPAPLLQGGVDQFKSGLGFAARHQFGRGLSGSDAGTSQGLSHTPLIREQEVLRPRRGGAGRLERGTWLPVKSARVAAMTRSYAIMRRYRGECSKKIGSGARAYRRYRSRRSSAAPDRWCARVGGRNLRLGAWTFQPATGRRPARGAGRSRKAVATKRGTAHVRGRHENRRFGERRGSLRVALLALA